MTTPTPISPHLRIGIAVADAIRVEGLIALSAGIADLIPTTPAEAVRDLNLAMVLIDADDQVFALMAAFRRARASLRLLVLGQSNDPEYIGKIVTAGAKGYLTDSSSMEEIRMAISVVADGSIWAPRKVLASLIDTYSPQEPGRTEVRFTPREKEVLHLLIDGKQDRDIASTLGISVRTVQSVVAHLLRKFGVDNRVALTVRILERFVLH